MRDFDATTDAYIGGRTDIVARHLLWFTARNRTTGASETMGLWTGDDTRTFTVDSESRVYYGAGSVLEVEPIASGVDLEVRMLQVRLVGLTPEVAQLVRGYDTRLAPVVIHRMLLDLDSREPIAAPIRVWRGSVEEVSIRTGAAHSVDMRLASDARRLTRTLALFRSDGAMRTRSASDRFREFVDLAGRIPVWWGRERAGGPRG